MYDTTRKVSDSSRKCFGYNTICYEVLVKWQSSLNVGKLIPVFHSKYLNLHQNTVLYSNGNSTLIHMGYKIYFFLNSIKTYTALKRYEHSIIDLVLI